MDVAGLGQCCLDYLGLIDAFPPEDGKQEFHGLKVQGGGPAATSLVCLARLGRRTALIGRCGDDSPGRIIRQELAEEGVAVNHLREIAGAISQFAFIAANPAKGSRTVFWTRSSAGEVTVEELPLDLIRRAKVLHLDGLFFESSLAAARTAQAAGRPVVLDAGTLRPHSLELIKAVDHLVVGEPFARAFAPEASPEEAVVRLYRLGVKAAVITLGDRGSVGFDGRTVIRQPAFEVEVVDTTGAGDAYHGGYVDALLDGLDLAGRMERASAVAALSVTALGGRTALPNRRRLAGFLGS